MLEVAPGRVLSVPKYRCGLTKVRVIVPVWKMDWSIMVKVIGRGGKYIY